MVNDSVYCLTDNYALVGGATEAYGSLFVCVSGGESQKPLKTKRWQLQCR